MLPAIQGSRSQKLNVSRNGRNARVDGVAAFGEHRLPACSSRQLGEMPLRSIVDVRQNVVGRLPATTASGLCRPEICDRIFWSFRTGPSAKPSFYAKSGISYCFRSEILRCLRVGRHDRGLFTPLIHPIVHSFVPQPAVLRLKHPVAFVRKVQHFRRHLQHLQCCEQIEAL
jgi:hypothetical protein